MKRLTLIESLQLRGIEMPSATRNQIILGFLGAIAVLGLGAGWECDATRGGARICAKDVPENLQKPR